jgi:hypothetical protein
MNCSFAFLIHCFLISSPVAPTKSEAAQQVSGVRDAVVLLAGATPSSGVPATLETKAWKTYSNQVRTSWKQYTEKLGQPMMAWAKTEIPATPGTVFYPFSGPDFATVYHMFPGADRYVMVAYQRAERLVDLAELNPQASSQVLEVLTSAWQDYGRDGFFVTEYLDKYLYQNRVRIGPTTFLTTFLHLTGFTLRSVQPIEITAKGELVELPPETPNWVSVRFKLTKGGRPVTLDYLRVDLSNKGLEANPHHVGLLKTLATNPTLLKAASHLPQNKTFSVIAELVARNAPVIVQDETGISYQQLKTRFDTTLYGSFERAHASFPNYHRDLAQAFRERTDVRPLGFRVGYFKGGNYALIVANRRP